MSFFDVDPEAVAGAGRRTAATGDDWDAWASRADTLLRDSAGASGTASVRAAFEGYLSALNPVLQGLAAQARIQGGKAAGAAESIVDSDHESAQQLHRPGSAVHDDMTVLRRPITG